MTRIHLIANRRTRLLLVGSLGPLCLFVLLGYLTPRNPIRKWDRQLLDFLHGYEEPTPFNGAAERITDRVLEIGSNLIVVTVLLLVMTLLVRRRRFRKLAFVAASAGGVAVLAPLLKATFARTSIDAYEGASFPSGHAMRSMLLAAVLATLAWQTRWRWPALLAGGTFAGLLGVLLVNEQWHPLSDVLGAWLVTTAWVVLVGVALLARDDRRPESGSTRVPDPRRGSGGPPRGPAESNKNPC